MKKAVITSIIFLCSYMVFPQKSVAIYWDASYSMLDRKIEKEITFLDNYFKKHNNINVVLVTFSNEILLQSNYQVVNSNWESLKSELKNTIHDGSTSFSMLFQEQTDEYLLFTDGIENMDQIKAPSNKPIYVISTSQTTNIEDLSLISKMSSGRLIMLDTGTTKTQEEKTQELNSGIVDGYIEGVVSGIEGVLTSVSVINRSSNNGASTNSVGEYKLKAEVGDELVFSYLGKKTVRVIVNKADIINIDMIDIDQNLDAIVITKEYEEKEELVNTGNGLVDKKRLGYDVETIGSESISDLDTDMVGAVNGQFTNLELVSQGYDGKDISKFVGRGKNMTILGNQYGLIVIDGVPQSQSDSTVGVNSTAPSNHINPDLIHSVTYLKGLAATNKYGTLGRNGVLLITTKNAVLGGGNSVAEKSTPLGTTATYSGNAEVMDAFPNEPYINAIKTATDVNEAFNIYLNQRKIFGAQPSFYLDVYDYFKGWNNSLLSNRVLSNVLEIAGNDESALKSMAFKQQADGDYSGALNTYQLIAKLKPNSSQSYRDLALAHVYARNYEEALNLYNKIDKNFDVGKINTSGIKKTLTNEAKNFIALNRDKINANGTNPKYLKPIKYKSRIVFEWNDLDSEFDLSIVNPQNRFFTWSHTQAENSQRLIEEKNQGFGLEEFFLTSSDIGEWKFNIKYYGKTTKDSSPTFIKVTTYKNFGSPDQTKTIRVVRLDKQGVDQTVSKVIIR